jgi:hypothetical protein
MRVSVSNCEFLYGHFPEKDFQRFKAIFLCLVTQGLEPRLFNEIYQKLGHNRLDLMG